MTTTMLSKKDDIALYTQVANLVKAWIGDGTFLPGTKIPSVREMSKKLNVSISTITQAYSALEAHGHVEVKPQSGYYVKLQATALNQNLNIDTIKSKAIGSPRYVQKTSRNLDIVEACSNEKLTPLGGATIHSSLLPTLSLQKSLLKVTRNNPDKAMRYAPMGGNQELRREIAKRSIASGFKTDANSVIVTNGCTEALNIALKAATSPGDIVAVESPTFHGILRLIEDLGLQILELPTSSDEGIDLASLEEKAMKFPIKAALVTPNFLNPIGSLMSDQNKERLVQICYKHNITIIEDDIYADLYYTSKRPVALKAFDKKDRNYLCSSFSKTLSAGYRIGWVIPPENELEKLLLLKSTSSSSTNTILQLALADHLMNHNYDRHMRRLRQTLNQNTYAIKQTIQKYFPEGTKVSSPQGGCLLWLEFPNTVNTMQVYEKALKKNISVVPGNAFSSGNKYNNCLRINTGVPWSPEIEKALIEISKLCY